LAHFTRQSNSIMDAPVNIMGVRDSSPLDYLNPEFLFAMCARARYPIANTPFAFSVAAEKRTANLALTLSGRRQANPSMLPSNANCGLFLLQVHHGSQCQNIVCILSPLLLARKSKTRRLVRRSLSSMEGWPASSSDLDITICISRSQSCRARTVWRASRYRYHHI